MANYPNSVPSFTTHNNGDTIGASHVNALGDEVTAIGSGLLNGITHTLLLTSGQITFPASQNASSGANTLDDYEEGTFTPTLISAGGGAATYTTQQGNYVKIGQIVHVSIHIILATKGTLAAGALRVSALPFAFKAFATAAGGLSVPYFANFATSVTSVSAWPEPSDSYFHLGYVPAAGATSKSILQVSDVNATCEILVGGTYQAAA